MCAEFKYFNHKKYLIDENYNGYRKQYLFKFPNGYGASVVIGTWTYGGDKGLWEMALIKFLDNGKHELVYEYDFNEDVIGYLDHFEVEKLLNKIRCYK